MALPLQISLRDRFRPIASAAVQIFGAIALSPLLISSGAYAQSQTPQTLPSAHSQNALPPAEVPYGTSLELSQEVSQGNKIPSTVPTASPVTAGPSPLGAAPKEATALKTASVPPVAPLIRFDDILDGARESVDALGGRAREALDDVGDFLTERGRGLVEAVRDKPAKIRRFLEQRLESLTAKEKVGHLEQLRAAEYGDHWGTTYEVPVVQSSLDTTQAVLQAIAQNPGKTGAVLYALVRGQDLELTLVLPDGEPKQHTFKGVVPALQQANHQLRLGITDPLQADADEYLEPGQTLYKFLVSPFRKTLDRAGVDILMFSLDGGLRSLPVAALHDGRKFLVEHYAVAIIPSFGLLAPDYKPLTNAKVLVAGASRFDDLDDLPAVPVELATIQASWSTVNLLDNKFTLDAIQSARRKDDFAIAHLATHAVFKKGNPSKSFVQLWGDEQLTLDAIASLNFHRPPLELLVLSACQTAFGNDSAELGFAGISVQSGAKSVLASLWRVSDTGTLALMSEFYDYLGTLPTKAEALRHAQLAMLRGETASIEQLFAQRSGFSPPPDLGPLPTKDLTHPYFWAGFTLVGSPW